MKKYAAEAKLSNIVNFVACPIPLFKQIRMCRHFNWRLNHKSKKYFIRYCFRPKYTCYGYGKT